MKEKPTIPVVKDKYKVSNRQKYNKSLCMRGSLTLFVDEAVVQGDWEQAGKKPKIVGERTYPDSVIQCCLLLKMNYGLKLRQSTGFMSSLFRLMGKGHLPVPDYSTLCRRQGSLPVEISRRLEQGENLVVAIDSTGLKVCGEGEWKVRKHGWSKHRTWRKLHICIEVGTQEIIVAELTGNDEDDASTGAKMLSGKRGKISSVHGDGAYDNFGFREVLGSAVKQIIPPPKNATIKKGTKKKPLPPHLIQRNEAVDFIKEHGRKEWKKQTGYHKRSLSETGMFRYKTTFGGQINARKMSNQRTEVILKCSILNKYTKTGMPLSYKAA